MNTERLQYEITSGTRTWLLHRLTEHRMVLDALIKLCADDSLSLSYLATRSAMKTLQNVLETLEPVYDIDEEI